MKSVKTPKHRDDKSLASYIIGFVLSLIFTIIPYYVVVNHLLKGSSLLLAILGFAVVQLIVQVTFFLHLGRGPKPNWNLFFFAATLGIILIVVGGSLIIINNLHRNLIPADQARRIVDNEGIYQVGGETTGACHSVRTNHVITIKDGKTLPLLTIAKKCDTLTFVDKDTANLDIGFGSARLNMPYAGLSSVAVPKGHSKTITLSELGTFQFHDRVRPLVIGSFAVFEQN